VTIKFTHEAVLKGYSFLAGEVHSLPDEIGELMILDGVAFRVSSREDKINHAATDALKQAKERDGGNR
jgi:hypothetical protein